MRHKARPARRDKPTPAVRRRSVTPDDAPVVLTPRGLWLAQQQP